MGLIFLRLSVVVAAALSLSVFGRRWWCSYRSILRLACLSGTKSLYYYSCAPYYKPYSSVCYNVATQVWTVIGEKTFND